VEVADDRDEPVLAGLGAEHAQRGGERVDVERAEALVQEQRSQTGAGAAVQLDQRESQGQGCEEGLPPDKVLDCGSLRCAGRWPGSLRRSRTRRQVAGRIARW
jgi:hypothetical protein